MTCKTPGARGSWAVESVASSVVDARPTPSVWRCVMSLRLVSVVGLVGLLGAAAAQADDKALTAEMKKLEGTWAPTENILNGVPTPEAVLKPLREIVKGNTYEGTVDGRREAAGTW